MAVNVLEAGGILMDLPWVLSTEGFSMRDTAQNQLRVPLPGPGATRCHSVRRKAGCGLGWVVLIEPVA